MNFTRQFELYREHVEGKLHESFQPGERAPSYLQEPMQYVISLGGKRLRPIMTLAACEAFGGRIDEAGVPALGMELFHNFSLIHDDIMDHAPKRRGKTTVHEKWSVSTGIISGDLMMIKAYEYLAQVKDDILPDVLAKFADIAAKVCEGQQWDMEFEKRQDVTLAEYELMIMYKTAVLMGCSLYIGARIGGANVEDAEAMYAFGCEVGLAFQMKDDWLDVFGDSEKVGKQRGGDILAAKKTFIYVKACEIANPTQRSTLTKAYQETTPAKERLDVTLEIFDELRISNLTDQMINRKLDSAMQYLDFLPVAKSGKKFLQEFAELLVIREY